MIIYCIDKNPLLSILIEILLENCNALVDGLRRLILYLEKKFIKSIVKFLISFLDFLAVSFWLTAHGLPANSNAFYLIED